MNQEPMAGIYEELADYYAGGHDSRHRDRFLVLASEEAMTAGRPEEAERLRQRLLRHSPFHLLKPFASYAEAREFPDVQDFITELKRQYPRDRAEKLLRGQGLVEGTEPESASPSEAISDSPSTPASPFQPGVINEVEGNWIISLLLILVLVGIISWLASSFFGWGQ